MNERYHIVYSTKRFVVTFEHYANKILVTIYNKDGVEWLTVASGCYTVDGENHQLLSKFKQLRQSASI